MQNSEDKDVFRYTSSPAFRKETMESGKFFDVINILMKQVEIIRSLNILSHSF
jgi:hypothetical protein